MNFDYVKMDNARNSSFSREQSAKRTQETRDQISNEIHATREGIMKDMQAKVDAILEKRNSETDPWERRRLLEEAQRIRIDAFNKGNLIREQKIEEANKLRNETIQTAKGGNFSDDIEGAEKRFEKQGVVEDEILKKAKSFISERMISQVRQQISDPRYSDSREQIVNTYKKTIIDGFCGQEFADDMTKMQEQRRSLSNWIEYILSDDSKNLSDKNRSVILSAITKLQENSNGEISRRQDNSNEKFPEFDKNSVAFMFRSIAAVGKNDADYWKDFSPAQKIVFESALRERKFSDTYSISRNIVRSRNASASENQRENIKDKNEPKEGSKMREEDVSQRRGDNRSTKQRTKRKYESEHANNLHDEEKRREALTRRFLRSSFREKRGDGFIPIDSSLHEQNMVDVEKQRQKIREDRAAEQAQREKERGEQELRERERLEQLILQQKKDRELARKKEIVTGFLNSLDANDNELLQYLSSENNPIMDYLSQNASSSIVEIVKHTLDDLNRGYRIFSKHYHPDVVRQQTVAEDVKSERIEKFKDVSVRFNSLRKKLENFASMHKND